MYLFRVVFSNDVDSYYSEVPEDISISFTVEANNFTSAEVKADQVLAGLTKYPNEFHIVAISKLDNPKDAPWAFPIG